MYLSAIGTKPYATIPSGEMDGIRILSIHKSKGLEFHTVLIPFCDWKLENETNNQLIWCSPSESPFSALDIVPVNYSSTMALTACLGMGDEEIMNLLPGKFDTSKALIVGLRSWDKGMQERQKELGIKGLAPKETADNSSSIMKWLKSTGTSKVVIHFDLDVIDPADMIAGVGVEPDGMKTEEVVRVINDIASEYDLVGLTIAEPMPRIAIKIRNMLNQLPLLKE